MSRSTHLSVALLAAGVLVAAPRPHVVGQAQPDADLARLARDAHKRRLPEELVWAAYAALARYPLADHPHMWAELAGAYAIAARAALEGRESAKARDLVDSYLRAAQGPLPEAAGNVLRACHLRAVAIEGGPQRAAELLATYRDAGGMAAWGEKGLDVPLLAAAEVLQGAGRPVEVEQLLNEAIVAHPGAIPIIARAQYEFYTSRADHSSALRAARLGFAFCPYRERAIQAWAQRLARAFSASGRAAEGVAFAQGQTDPHARNPLAHIPLPELGADQRELLLANAQGNPAALVNAHLLLSQWGEALRAAQQIVADGRPERAQAGIRTVAKCFKAKDLNLIRANRFIEYSRTGEGENPVNTF